MHEGVRPHLVHRQPELWLRVKHVCEQVLQLWAKAAAVSSLGDLTPVDFWLLDEALVEEVASDVSSIERWEASDHREERNAQGKQVHLVTLVGLACQNFRSFQPIGA